jgi:hypothetical protein
MLLYLSNGSVLLRCDAGNVEAGKCETEVRGRKFSRHDYEALVSYCALIIPQSS